MGDPNFIREKLSKNMDPDKFFAHVMRVVERKLIEWEHDVYILYDWSHYKDDVCISFIIDDRFFTFYLGKKEIESLQRKSPYFLDRLIWTELIKRGIVIRENEYMKVVFQKK